MMDMRQGTDREPHAPVAQPSERHSITWRERIVTWLLPDALKVSKAEPDLDSKRADLENRVAARTEQLQAVIAVGRAASEILDPDRLTAEVVDLITTRFGYYYAAIFLVNESGDFAELRDATGAAGKRLKAEKHRLRVGGNSMVGTAISTGRSRIALDAQAEPARFVNPLLPETRSEVALPLTVANRVLGALDVQSTEIGAFGPEVVDTLQGMATQLAIAIENARLFQASKVNLEEMQAIQRQSVLSAWKPLSGAENLEYTVGDDDLPPGSNQMDFPMSLRDELIGGISLAGASDWTPEQHNLVESVVTQAALALEHARLVEAGQSSARREHILADITAQVWASPSIDGVLRAAVSELGRALGADEATIEIRPESTHE
jgi:GAF domain-containing protein